MSYVDAMEAHIQQMTAGIYGETVEYRRWTGPGPIDFEVTTPAAVVERSPTTPMGEILVKTVRVTISKADLTAVTIEKDQIWVVPTIGGTGTAIKHRVVRVEAGPGHWDIEAVR